MWEQKIAQKSKEFKHSLAAALWKDSFFKIKETANANMLGVEKLEYPESYKKAISLTLNKSTTRPCRCAAGKKVNAQLSKSDSLSMRP